MTTRCKVLCTSVKKVDAKSWYTEPKVDFLYEAFFVAVTGGSSPENKQFFASTPTLTLEVKCINGDRFEQGKEYYLDISLAN
jgi:hypothetical protein